MHHHFWSKNRNVHFGYFRWGDNPFRLESMLLGMNDFVASQLDIDPAARLSILDIGCGYGATIAHLHAKFPNLSFTGINSNAAEINFAKKQGIAANLVLASFESIPFDDGCFDGAYALESACYAQGETKSRFIKEASRVLKPGAKLLVVDGFRKHNRTLPKLVDWCYRKCTAAWEIPSLASLPAFVGELKKHGFENVTKKDISWNGLPSLVHIPIVVVKLMASYLLQKDAGKLQYLRALLLTLAMSPFKSHFGYYLVTCTKSTVELKN